ncbi:MAG: hypothetical protein GX786_00345 [Clostridiales bacterium]|nr:hypothetical protein [Clostridiales bacterium]
MEVYDDHKNIKYTLVEERLREPAALIESFSAKDGGIWMPGRIQSKQLSAQYYLCNVTKIDQQGKALFHTLLDDPDYQINGSYETQEGDILCIGYYMPGKRYYPMALTVSSTGELCWIKHNHQVDSGTYEGIVPLGENVALIGKERSAQGIEAWNEWIDIMDSQGKLLASYTLTDEITQTYCLYGRNLYWAVDEKTIQTVRFEIDSGISYFTTITLP